MQIPVFPLNTVLFPGGVLPLRIFEPRYMDMARNCLKNDKPFGVCLIREGREVGAPAVPEPVGCLARIAHWDMQQLGLLNVRTIGGERFRLLSTRTGPQNLVLGEAELLPLSSDAMIGPEHAQCVELLRRFLQQHDPLLFPPPHRYESASWVSYRLAEILPLPPAIKQQLLERDAPLERLGLLSQILDATREADS